ncbi:MAG: tetratricopeptide repeat protein [Asgard group archaeon]|nr:tetratricopeptide repeat protein [Asgard group archaeon]
MSKKKKKEEALAYYYKGKKAYEQGKIDASFTDLDTAYQFFKHTEDHPIIADILRIQGEILFEKDNLIESRNHYKKAYLSFKSFGNKIGMADCYDQIALSFMLQSELIHAFDYQQKALKLRESTPDKRGLARARKNLAVIIYQKDDDGEKALQLLNDAMELAKKGKDPQLVINIAIDLSKIHSKLGLFDEAMKNFVIARRFSKSYNIKLSEEHEKEFGDLLLNLGFQKYDEGQYEESLKFLKNAALILKAKNDPLAEEVEATIVKIEMKIKDS